MVHKLLIPNSFHKGPDTIHRENDNTVNAHYAMLLSINKFITVKPGMLFTHFCKLKQPSDNAMTIMIENTQKRRYILCTRALPPFATYIVTTESQILTVSVVQNWAETPK